MKRNFAIILFFVFAAPLNAGEFLADQSIVIKEKMETDIYAAGSLIDVSAPLGGDLWATGSSITVNAPIQGDLNALGGSISLREPVSGDIRAGGGTIEIRHNSGGDMILTGGTISIPSKVKVGEDLIAAAGELNLNGSVAGKAYLAAGSLHMDGKIKGPARITADSLRINGEIQGDVTLRAQKTLEIGPEARFAGKVQYWTGSGEIDFGDSIASGHARFDPSLRLAAVQESERTHATGFAVLTFGSGLILIGLLHYLFSGFFLKAGEWLLQNPLRSMGAGLLYYLLTPLAILLLLIVIIGIPLGLFALSIYGFSIGFAVALSTPVLAMALRKKLNKEWNGWSLFGVSAGVYLVLAILGSIPIIGWILSIIVSLAGVGSILFHLAQLVQSSRKTAEAS